MKFAHENDYNDIIHKAAVKWNVDDSIIKGVIAQESNFISSAYRAEPYISPTTGKPRTWLTPTADFPQGGDASFGLMQMLARTARLFGFTGPKENLFDPATNVDLGTRYLSNLITKYQKLGKPLQNALSEYNGGAGSTFGGAPAGGPFANQAYVNNVMNYIAYFQSTGSDGEAYYSGDASGDVVDTSQWDSEIPNWDTLSTTEIATGGSAIAIVGAVLLLALIMKRKKRQ
jgi:soluble lytic murein transglycosylase-like protein